ncbi:hypothetical protein LOC68_16515 [Blastopirellula sp. JC732]|uniref:Uncharacterized protein n=1 Tax=Blastopirellula sediminis TaxID=2894196 RepID=A0A9X1SHC1_9BACT|nr:hypothetical protein [Blastopirellula sediminis]MCC9606706.1 hypothetical protein [Blastopirellula sediminis]MCC9629997.1 hypothetical protein [Blastopirellula sediminis]
MTDSERSGQYQTSLRPPRELVFWAVLAIVVAMAMIGLIVGVAVHEALASEVVDAAKWGETVVAIVVLSAPVLAPIAMFYMSVFCRVKMAAVAVSVALGMVATVSFFGMLAATFYSEIATAVLLVSLAVSLRVGHLNTSWYKLLSQEDAPPRAQFWLVDAGLAFVSLAIISSVAAWTWTWDW